MPKLNEESEEKAAALPQRCGECDGDKVVKNAPCPVCGGEGVIKE